MLFNTRPAPGTDCAHSNKLVFGSADTALHGTALGPQMVATTPASLFIPAGPCTCAAVTLLLRNRANTAPERVTTVEAGLIATPLIVKLPDGFTEACIAEPVACCSTNEGNDPTGVGGMGGGAEKFDMLNRDMNIDIKSDMLSPSD